MTTRLHRPRVGLVVDATDHFLQPLERTMSEKYVLSRFMPRFIKAPIVGSSVNKLLLEIQFRRFLADQDVAFFEWAGSLLVKATHMAKRCQIVTRLHSMEVATSAHLTNWAQVDATIVVSNQMKQRLLKVAPTAPAPIHVVHHGMDLKLFHPVPRNFDHRIGMMARVVPVKRVYEAVLTVYELRRQGHPFTLTVAGPLGDELEPRYPWAIRELIERLQLQEHVTLLGPVSDPANFYSSIDIFLSNSFWEGQQNALLEAMASGNYCLSHCWGGAEEVLPPEQIFVTDADLQEKLLAYSLLSNAEKATRQARMRQLAEDRFDECKMIEQTLRIIDGVAR